MISFYFWIAYYYIFLYFIGFFILSFIQLRLKFQKIKEIIKSNLSDSSIVKSIKVLVLNANF